MTDNEIIKALPFLAKYCKKEYNDIKVNEVLLGSFDLINRLQSENEDIKFLYENLKEEHLEIIKVIKRTKTEAYKECIEKVKAEINKHSYGVLHKTVINFKLDNLLNELVGDNQ